MAQPYEVTVDLQELEGEEERAESLDLRQIRTRSGMWDKLLYITRGHESYWGKENRLF